MKQNIPPAVAVIIIVIVVVVVGGFLWMKTSRTAPVGPQGGPPPLPAETMKNLSEAMSKAGKQQGTSAPNAPSGPGVQLGPGGVPAPPPPP
jgi:hypothetical protein